MDEITKAVAGKLGWWILETEVYKPQVVNDIGCATATRSEVQAFNLLCEQERRIRELEAENGMLREALANIAAPYPLKHSYAFLRKHGIDPENTWGLTGIMRAVAEAALSPTPKPTKEGE